MNQLSESRYFIEIMQTPHSSINKNLITETFILNSFGEILIKFEQIKMGFQLFVL